MNSQTHAAAHIDHIQWLNEFAMWRDDIEQWQTEHDAALLAVTSCITSYNTALQKHLEAIGQHQTLVLESEHFVAECERSDSTAAGEIDRSLGEQHRLHSAKQSQLRDAHEQVKGHHRAAMTQLSLIAHALSAPI